MNNSFLKNHYRNIFVVDSIHWANSIEKLYDNKLDLVLTFDFHCFKYFKDNNFEVYFIDRLLDKQVNDINNFKFYDFFKKWHLDSNGNDIFKFKGIEFGFALRLEIWNDLSFFVRNVSNLQLLKTISIEKVYLGTDLMEIKLIFRKLGIEYLVLPKMSLKNNVTYFFDIHKWMDEKVRYTGFKGIKYVLRDLASLLQGSILILVDLISFNHRRKNYVFIQEYHPTQTIIRDLSLNTNLKIVLATFNKSFGAFRYIPIFPWSKKYDVYSNNLLKNLDNKKCEKLILENSLDITDVVYEIIQRRIAPRLNEYINELNCIIRYFKIFSFKLIVLVTNIGKTATLVSCVAKANKVPSYLVINGIMSGDFLDESKYADFINSYSTSIKNNYFKGMNNVVTLGDPRMDRYSNLRFRKINYERPTISIGTSAYSVIDLNSNLAIEFEFIYDIAIAIKHYLQKGYDFNVILKVRPNGYIEQYKAFFRQYFPEMVNIEFYDNVSMNSIFEKTDLYISLYSQTLFEASCWGIPCIYYMNHRETIDPPFDGKVELVTAINSDELVDLFMDFMNKDAKFDLFRDKKNMEKYIGHLDGNNLKRNIDFINNLISN